MITAVDSCVLLDILVNDPDHGANSLSALKQAKRDGRLIVCELVVVEIAPVVGAKLKQFLKAASLDFDPCSFEAAADAGSAFSDYLKRGGKRGRIVPDFLIAEHSVRHADRLLTRDQGFDRDYFSHVVVWYP